MTILIIFPISIIAKTLLSRRNIRKGCKVILHRVFAIFWGIPLANKMEALSRVQNNPPENPRAVSVPKVHLEENFEIKTHKSQKAKSVMC